MFLRRLLLLVLLALAAAGPARADPAVAFPSLEAVAHGDRALAPSIAHRWAASHSPSWAEQAGMAAPAGDPAAATAAAGCGAASSAAALPPECVGTERAAALGTAVTPVPEPFTWVLLLAGLAGMGLYTRGRRGDR